MKIKDFLVSFGLDPSCVDVKKIAEFKMSEMKNSLAGKASSLEMINSFCKPVSSIKLDRKVIAIDAGGTNLRTALFSFSKDGKLEIINMTKNKMPGLNAEISSEQFFSVFADSVEPFLGSSNYIGWCFSYSAEILPNHDAKVHSVSKEIKAESIVGLELGKNLFSELSKRGHDMSNKSVMVFNDSVTTLLAGLSKTEELGCNGCLGFILGTGTNSSYIEGDTIINEESGSLDVYESETDLNFFKTTRVPSYHHLEKLISGAYLGLLASAYIKEAINNSVFSEEFGKKFSEISNLCTIDISEYLLGKSSKLSNCISIKEDAENLKILLESHISRAAKFSAGNLAGTILNTNFGINNPVLISVDGTTFINVPNYGSQIGNYLNSFLSSYNRSAIFTHVDNSSLVGAAIGTLEAS